MTTVVLTRYYSLFVNVQDRYSVGNHEADGDAATETYALPDGYSVIDGDICDPDNIVCLIYPAQNGKPTLISAIGNRERVTLEVAQ